MDNITNCELCGRQLAMPYDEHHVVPKGKGRKKTVTLHRICHSKIHSVFTLTELRTHFSDIENVKKHDEIKKFIRWVSTKPPAFYKRTRTLKK